jgi:hypothetical protein
MPKPDGMTAAEDQFEVVAHSVVMNSLQAVEPARSPVRPVDRLARTGGSAAAELQRLGAGSTRWLCQNLEYFELSSCWPSATLKVKACIELALLNRLWQRSIPADPARDQVTATLLRIWQDPGFLAALEAGGREVRRFRLGYAALAPAGLADELRLAVLATMAPDGYLTPYGKSPSYRLETRYFAELAGLEHSYESYQELFQGTILAHPPAEFDLLATYELTHAIFHLTDFGHRPMAAPNEERDRVRQLITGLTRRFVNLENSDITAELVLCQFCLGMDPTRTSSGTVGIRLLLHAQLADGAVLKLPGQEPTGTPETSFLSAYHATLVVGLLALILLRAMRGN